MLTCHSLDSVVGRQVVSDIIPSIAHLMKYWPLSTDMMWTPSYTLLAGRKDNTINATDLVQTDELTDSFAFE